jgi:hypothetical protein
MWSRQKTLVFDPVWSKRVVAARNLADPVGRIAREVGNGFGGEAACQQPQELPVTALDRIWGLAVPNTEFICAQVGFEVNGSRHASLCTTLWHDRV